MYEKYNIKLNQALNFFKKILPERIYKSHYGNGVITAMGCRQCLPLSVVKLICKHCQKPHCRNGVVDIRSSIGSQ